MNIAIASCSDLPEWEIDDQSFFDELTRQNINYQILPWDSDTDWNQFDICLLRTTWDYQERIDEFLLWIEAVSEQTQLINSKSIIQWNSHKRYLQELEQAGITIAPSEWLLKGESHNVKALIEKHGWQEGFIKPLIGANARECLRFDLSEAGLAAAQHHVDRLCLHEDLVLQPYLSNVETFGETSGIFFSGQYSHGTRKVPVDGDFRVQDDYGASDYVYHLTEDEQALAIKAIDHVKNKVGIVPLYARVDFLHHKDGTVFLNEMELIEPSLFFRHGGNKSCKLFAEELVNCIKQTHN